MRRTAGRIKVGILINTFNANAPASAGGNLHYTEVAKRWPSFDLVVFGPEAARAVVEEALPRARFTAIPTLALPQAYKQVENLMRSLSSALVIRALRRCDVLLATSHFLPDVLPALFARGGRSAITLHHLLEAPGRRPGSFLPNAISYVFQALAIRLARNRAARFFVTDSELATAAGLADDGRLVFITHGADHLAGEFDAAAATRDRHRALFLGRLVPTKGVDDLIDAWAIVLRAMPNARLTIAGTGEEAYERRLRASAERLGIGNSIEFVGFVDDQARARLLSTHDLFVFPSKEEGWGIAIAEAMHSGLPAVTYDLPAYRHVFTSGRRSVATGDVAALASEIVRLYTDAPMLEALSEDARRLGRTFTWDHAAQIERDAILAMMRSVV